MSLGGGGRQLEALSQQIEELEEAEEELERRIEAFQAEKAEIDDAMAGLEGIETGSTVQVPVGGDAHVRAEVEAIDDVVVGIGADYLVEQSRADAIEVLERKQDDLDERIEETRSEIAEVEEERLGLEQEVQQSQQQLLQQQAQGRAAADEDDG